MYINAALIKISLKVNKFLYNTRGSFGSQVSYAKIITLGCLVTNNEWIVILELKIKKNC